MNGKNKDFYRYLSGESGPCLNPESGKTDDACFNNSLLSS